MPVLIYIYDVNHFLLLLGDDFYGGEDMFLSAIDEKGGHASARSSSAPMSSSTGLKSDALLGKETVMTARVASGAYLVVRWVFAKNLVVALVVVWWFSQISQWW